MDLFESLFRSFDKPRWREELELNIYELERRTGLSKEQLFKVADVLEELKIIRL